MITRGHFVGEIIDDLAEIANQANIRCKLGLTDINKYLEDFFKDVLNEILKIKLVNLNQNRINFPGLDLGDKLGRIAFQITSTKNSHKVNETLKKITDKQANEYNDIKVLVIGSKQGTYSLDSNLCKNFDFTQDDIWDITDLCKKALDLPLVDLQKLYSLVTSEFVRVKIELEIPDQEGHFPTTINNYIEKPPSPKLGTFEKYCQFHQNEHPEFELTLQDVRKDFERLTQTLLQLPRITREFYAFLLKSRDTNLRGHGIGSTPSFSFNYDRLRRIYRHPDIEGEIRLLSDSGFVDFIRPDDRTESPYLRIFVISESDNFLFELVEYIEEKKIEYHPPIVNLDFSDF